MMNLCMAFPGFWASPALPLHNAGLAQPVVHTAPQPEVPDTPALLPEAVGLLILDLDGTVRACTVPGQPCPNKPGQQRLLKGAAEGIQAAMSSGIQVAFATNQAGVALGYMTHWELQRVLDELTDLFIAAGLDRAGAIAVYACTHHPDAGCTCRKPQPGMLSQAMDDHNVPPERTLFVGDRDTDRQAAEAAECQYMDAVAWRRLYK